MEPSLKDYSFPDPLDCLLVFNIGFLLYERAWTLRGMEKLMMDFIEHPESVAELKAKLDELTKSGRIAPAR